MPKKRWIIAAAWLSLCATNPARAAASAPRFTVAPPWTVDEGLPQNSVIALTQTRDGYLWLGTGNGLARFDGIHFRNYDDSDIPGLNGSKIIKLFEDSQRNLWMGTESSGVLRVAEDGSVTNVPLPESAGRAPVVGLCEDASGAVWVRMASGELFRYRGGSAELIRRNSRSVVAEDSGLVMSATFDGILETLGPAPKSNTVGQVDFLLASPRGGYWLLADGRVRKCKGDHIQRELGPYPWQERVRVLAACEDPEGNLIVGTYGDGVYWYDAEGRARRLPGLPHDYIWSLTMDRGGCLWVGTDGAGLSRVTRQNFDVLEGTRGLTVKSACADRQGGLWIGYNGEHIDHWSGGALRVFTNLWPSELWPWLTSSEANPRLYVRTVLEDRNEQLWAGVSGGLGTCLFSLQHGRFRPTPVPVGVSQDVSVIFQDKQGAVWIGTQTGLARWDGRSWKVFTAREGLSSAGIRALAEDAEGNIWVGTEHGGLNRLHEGKFTAFRKRDTNSVPGDDISSLYVDADGVLWVGTSSGLGRFARGQWTRYSVLDGLTSNKIGYLLEDGLGYLWLGSNAGLMRLAKKELNDFANGTVRAITCRTFGKAEGLPTGECSSGSQPGACRTSDGKLWFPTIKGLAMVEPSQLGRNTNPPPVIIESVWVDRELQNPETLRSSAPVSVTVPAGKEAIEIDFTSLNLSAPDKVHFRYRLEGHETAWTPGDSQERKAHYTRLPPGDYRFRVAACNEDGVWNEAGASLAIVVLPPFWRTPWFLAVASACLLALIVGPVYYVSTQRLQRQLAVLRQQEALERERARIARDLHDQLGANLTQVALLGEMAETDKELPAEVEAHARQIAQTARDTTHALDEIVWTVNPANDTLDGLVNYICKYAQEYLALADLRYRLEVPAELPSTPISPELRHNVFLAAKEAVNNVVKHAQASAAWVRLRLEAHRFTLEIEDNGCGLPDLDKKTDRNGLRNMRKRMEDVGGEFEIGRGAEGGARVRLSAPLPNSESRSG